jgi:6-phospho-3-hexuloisomerase
MIKKNIKKILNEIESVFTNIDEDQVQMMIDEIVKARKIIGLGAGRVGMSTRAFLMRLGHLDFQAYMIGDTTVPSISNRDLLLVSSGSGETQTIYDLTIIAKSNGARIVAVTGNQNSRIGKLADHVVVIDAPSKTKQVDGITSIQPMTTLNEQCLLIFFDAVVLELMNMLKESHDSMWKRHSNLE